MALSEKDVFYALLRNHGMSLKTLCEQSGMQYHSIVKRADRGTIQDLDSVDIECLCRPLSVSYEDFYFLMVKAKAGEFPDDYPKKEIKLETRPLSYLKARTIAMILTPQEKEIIDLIRKCQQEAAQSAMEFAEFTKPKNT